MRVVVDTSVFIAAVSSPDGASREVLRRCLEGEYEPVMGQALLSEYEAVLGREAPFVRSPVSDCLLYTSPSPRDRTRSRMPSSA